MEPNNSVLAAFIARRKQEENLREKPFPLKYLLYLYVQGHKDSVYCKYFEGFRLLIKWLGPIESPPLTNQKVFLPFYGYEQQEIARHLNIHPAIVQSVLMEIYNESNA